MRLGLNVGYSGSSAGLAMDVVREAERLGFHSVWTAEAYGSDAVTPAAWIAAQTSRIRVGTAIMQLAGRTPALAATTALTLDQLSGGRFLLGLGVSGPQVVEGWHGVPFGLSALDAPNGPQPSATRPGFSLPLPLPFSPGAALPVAPSAATLVVVSPATVLDEVGHGLSFVLPDAAADTARPCSQPWSELSRATSDTDLPCALLSLPSCFSSPMPTSRGSASWS